MGSLEHFARSAIATSLARKSIVHYIIKRTKNHQCHLDPLFV
jgi:hypothetical protein